MSKETPTDPADLLRKHGTQVTAQRLAVLRVVSRHPHRTADQIEESVRPVGAPELVESAEESRAVVALPAIVAPEAADDGDLVERATDYGLGGDDPIDESASPQPIFQSQLCQEWEAAAAPADGLGARVVRLRIGLVLGRSGGALPQLARPVLAGAAVAGGTVASGTVASRTVASGTVGGRAVVSGTIAGGTGGSGPARSRSGFEDEADRSFH